MANYRYRQLTQVGPSKVLILPEPGPLPAANQSVPAAGAFDVMTNEREASFEALVAMLDQGHLSASRDLVFAQDGWRTFDVVPEFLEAARRSAAKVRRTRLVVAGVLLVAAVVGGAVFMVYR
jgi:hypothetical protein